jgi:hypothetical protein
MLALVRSQGIAILKTPDRIEPKFLIITGNDIRFKSPAAMLEPDATFRCGALFNISSGSKMLSSESWCPMVYRGADQEICESMDHLK